jgi:hypothetical protein
VVEAPLLPSAQARGAGVRAAAAEVVVLGETHAFPEPGWAERLLERHAEGWASVSPAIANGNPDGALSWSSLAMDYGRWSSPRSAELVHVPSYNASFKRELLLAYGEELPRMLEPGLELSADLRRRGHRLLLDAAARVRHLNASRPRSWLRERYLGGRLLGSARRGRWSRLRSTAYALAAPLIPLVIVRRTLRATRASGPPPRRGLAALALGSIVFAAGEVVGYVAGAGGAERSMLELELHKATHVASAPG